MADRLISADALLKEWRLECGGACFIRKDKYCTHYDTVKGTCKLITDSPTIEAEPRKHGKPIPLNVTYEVDGKVYARQYSSECPFCGDSGAKNYCPNCGAKMDEVK